MSVDCECGRALSVGSVNTIYTSLRVDRFPLAPLSSGSPVLCCGRLIRHPTPSPAPGEALEAEVMSGRTNTDQHETPRCVTECDTLPSFSTNLSASPSLPMRTIRESTL